eukprot:TRINITY_DN20124_c0_g1_i1.p1 TRINITY_DN20124_c0_g1~~TRINITY_DN20124_c0_g1_i1.p1  ORF type:complete len:490 (+),score=100.95 TRINITY_DN20124_c0_g1_i1:77-1471(+)
MEADLEATMVKGEGEESLWEKVLAEYREHGSTVKARDDYQLYVVGEKGDEKMRVVRWLTQRSEDDEDEDEVPDHGLSFGYGEWKEIPMGDEDELTVRITHTVIHQKEMSNLFQSSFTGPGGKRKLPTAVFAIVLDLSTPHHIMNRLTEWYQFLKKAVTEDICNDDLEYIEHLRQREKDECEKFHTNPATAVKKKVQVDADLEIVDSPTDFGRTSQSYQKMGIFKQGNLGVPLVVICTKAGKLEALAHARHSKDPKDKHHFLNYIQAALRKWCIERGAALLYADGEKESGELLRGYLLFRLAKIPMKSMMDDRRQIVRRTPAAILENNTKLFVPAYADALPAVAKLQQGKFMDLPWADVVPFPKSKRNSEAPPEAAIPEDFSKLLAEQKKNAAESNVLGPSTRVENIRRRTATMAGAASGGSKPSLEATAETFFSNMIKTYKRKNDSKKPTTSTSGTKPREAGGN